MTHIDKNSLKHFTVCFILSLIGAYGMSADIGASLTKVWYDKKSYGNWCWLDLLFDFLCCAGGMAAHWWIFNSINF